MSVDLGVGFQVPVSCFIVVATYPTQQHCQMSEINGSPIFNWSQYNEKVVPLCCTWPSIVLLCVVAAVPESVLVTDLLIYSSRM